MKPRHFGVFLALGAMLLLAACGEDNDIEFTTPTPVSTNTQARPTNTQPPATSTPIPATSTPIPATNTPAEATATPTNTLPATATPTVEEVATATPTQTLAPEQVRVSLSHASGAPGSTVQIEVSLQTNGKIVAGTQNDILFDPALISLAKSSDCKINEAIGDKLAECEEDPPTAPCKQLQRNLADCPGAEGCPQGSEGLKRLRAIILATGNINPIPDAVLYTCTFSVTGTGATTAILQNLNRGASDPSGNALATAGGDGSVTILGPTPTTGGESPTPTNTVGVATSTPTSTSIPPTSTETATPPPTSTPTTGGQAICGNGSKEAGEDCDDGNLLGADGCAANCTNEVPAECPFGCVQDGDTEICSGANVTTILFELPLEFTGGQTLMAGHPRGVEVTTTDPEVTFKPSEVPVVLKAADLRVAPVQVPGLVCACVRGEDLGEFGPGNAGSGVLGCNDAGLDEVDYIYEADHNVNPGHPQNGGGLPDDPGCENGELEDGSPRHPHTGICNDVGLPVFTGNGPRGSAVIISTTSISLLQDGGACTSGDCSEEDYGPDCEPCTADDVVRDPPRRLATTTGTANARLYDANNRSGRIIETTLNGAILNCDALLADPDNPDLSGSALVSAFGAIDSPTIGDNATTSTFACAVAPAP